MQERTRFLIVSNLLRRLKIYNLISCIVRKYRHIFNEDENKTRISETFNSIMLRMQVRKLVCDYYAAKLCMSHCILKRYITLSLHAQSMHVTKCDGKEISHAE